VKSETTTHRFIQNICSAALKESLIIALMGEPGIGKTRSLGELSQRSGEMHFLSLGKSFKPINFYRSILRSVSGREPDPKLTLYQTMTNCVEEIKFKGKRLLLIIDEGGKINSYVMIEFIHELSVQTEGKLGIVISGPPYMKLIIDRWVRTNKPGAQEFSRRVNVWTTVPQPTQSDFEIMLKSEGITESHLISLFTNGARTYADVKNRMIAYNVELEMNLHLNS